jgi:penicillin-binding protein 2
MQLAYTIGGITLGGAFKQPHLVRNNQPVPEVTFPIAESTVEAVTSAMYGVVNEGGTAAGSRLPGIELSGKTGTAQTISATGLQRAGNRAAFKDNAWFVGFAPRRNPEIIVAVLVEGGEHGSSAAAPIARDVVRAHYEKKGWKPELLMTKAPAAASVPAAVLVRTAEPVEPAPAPAAPAEEQLPAASVPATEPAPPVPQ